MALTGIMPYALPVTSAYTHLQMSLIYITHTRTQMRVVCACAPAHTRALSTMQYIQKIFKLK